VPEPAPGVSGGAGEKKREKGSPGEEEKNGGPPGPVWGATTGKKKTGKSTQKLTARPHKTITKKKPGKGGVLWEREKKKNLAPQKVVLWGGKTGKDRVKKRNQKKNKPKNPRGGQTGGPNQ